MKRTHWIVTACLALITSISSMAAWAHDDRSDLERQTRYGKVVGAEDRKTDTYSWKGVPYAKAPIGVLRWKAPVDPEPWKKPLATQKFGNACVQYGRIYGPGSNNQLDSTIGTTLNQAVGNEDCLYLNIWRPASEREDLPVIVFVHGGSDVSGYTADPVYDGAALAKAAHAVVVTVNYRLGIFGFLNLLQLKTGTDALGDSGNFALLDIIKSLQFVRDNVDSFGGDKRNVTLMGQSAGAINVYALMTSPLVVNARQKLFHRLVALSGGLSLTSDFPLGTIVIPTIAPASTYLLQGQALLYKSLIADGLATDDLSAAAYAASHTPGQMAAYLRSKSPAALLGTLLAKLAALNLAGSGPIPEGVVLPVDPIAAIGVGDFLRVPLLAGNTRDEGKLFPTFLTLLGGLSGRLVTDAELVDIQLNYNPDAPAKISIAQWIPATYLPVNAPATGFNAKTDLLNQIFLRKSAKQILDALKAQQNDVWYYRFDWDEEPAPWNDIYGAAHLFDVPFLFGNFGPSLFSNVAFSAANKEGRLELSQAMMKSLAHFAKRGDPNAPAALGVHWPMWPHTLIFDATKTDKVISVQ